MKQWLFGNYTPTLAFALNNDYIAQSNLHPLLNQRYARGGLIAAATNGKSDLFEIGN